MLFSIRSNYEFVSTIEDESWCMMIPKNDFLEICDEFPAFHSYLQQRALMRRNYFKMLDLKRKDKEKDKELKMAEIERADINEDSDQEDNDDFLFNPQLMVLDPSEKPDTLVENI